MEKPIESISSLLSICEEYGHLSGFKVNWSKSALLPLNESAKLLHYPPTISVVQNFKYLGIQIFPSLNQIVTHNFLDVSKDIMRDLDRWINLPNSLQARIPIVKMNILPRLHFFSSMIPLSTHVNFWSKIHSNISQFIWNRKRPHLKLSTLQRKKEDGGLAVPNCKFYFWSFVLRPLHVWFNPHTSVSWRKIEENIVHPWNLEDGLIANVSIKQCRLRFGPIVAHLIHTWRMVESVCRISCRWHTVSYIQ